MKSIILSVQPKWCELIASGEKTIGETMEKRIEVRKTAPKEVPFKAYIYQTKKRWIYKLLPWLEKRQAKVIGEFVCDKVVVFEKSEHGVRCKDFFALAESKLTVKEMRDYIGNKKIAYGLHISELKIYDEPKGLSEFKTIKCTNKRGSCSDCKTKPDCIKQIPRPPQSWQYVEELPNEPSETR